MTLVLTESEVRHIKYFVCLSAANKLRIPDAESKSTETLRKLISSKNTQLAGILASFIETYDKWYEFHVRVDAAGKSGNLDAAESGELAHLVQCRDDTRETLLNALATAVLPPAFAEM